MIKHLFLFLLFILLLLGLTGLGFATFPWWGPPIFKEMARNILLNAGFSEAEVSLKGIGLSELRVDLEHFRYEGLALTDGDLRLGYTFEGLRRGELAEVKLSNPQIRLDLKHDWQSTKDVGESIAPGQPIKLSERLPVRKISLESAVLTIASGKNLRSFEFNGHISGQKALESVLKVKGDGIRGKMQFDLLWPDLSGGVNGALEFEQAEKWLNWGRDLGWLPRMEGVSLTLGALELSGRAEFVDGALKAWSIGRGFENLQALARIQTGSISWSEGGGLLKGLEGELKLASLQPLMSEGEQVLNFTSMEQGEFSTGPGRLRLSYDETSGDGQALQVTVETTALGGQVRLQIGGKIRENLDLSVRAFLDSIDLEAAAALFPQFEGQLEGLATGELAFGFRNGQIILKPGGLQLLSGTNGRFAYLRQGWLTQNPKLDPEAFVADRAILEIMKDPQGAPALTELAMRDLQMDAFHLRIQEEKTGQQSVVAQIKGSREIKGVTVPVVLDVPIRGDVKETINAVFEFNTRMRD